jgi:Putative auto-transporter adhesin, head GIN domain
MSRAFALSLLCMVTIVVAIGCGSLTLVGSGVIKSESRSVSAFTAIELDNSADVLINIGPETAVTVECDDNLLPIITTTVVNQTLKIDSTQPYSTRHGPIVTITTPTLSAVALNGSGNITVHDLSQDSLNASINGSGDISADGRADKIQANINGSGDLKFTNLLAQTGTVEIHGSGDANVNVATTLSAHIAGSGDIRYKGSPTVTTRISGSGDVRPE